MEVRIAYYDFDHIRCQLMCHRTASTRAGLEPQAFTGAEEYVDAGDILACSPIFDRSRSGGVVADAPADRRLGHSCRIGRIKKSGSRHGQLATQFVQSNSRFHLADSPLNIDRNHPATRR